MTYVLPALPYAQDALEPYISSETLSFHYGKHHQTYVDNLNRLLENHPLSGATLEEIILKSAKDPNMQGIFNNAGQVWNHTFYWNGMTPQGGGQPTDTTLREKITQAFGSFEEFCDAFKQAAVGQFGSGWAWLVADASGALSIVKTANADLPMTQGLTALLTCDVWEHAYYLDYQNRRLDHVDAFLKHLVNWNFVAENLARGMQK